MTGVRLLLTPYWVQIEYRTPGFPEDPYGFTLEERLKWSNISLDYLLNDEGISFLEQQSFEDGTPIYNARELKHMVDVKVVVKGALTAWWTSLAAVILIGGLAWQGGWFEGYRLALLRGSWLTIGLIASIVVVVVAAFGVFFVQFHNVFFDPGTWVFRYSDTLIRLFPERFWRDAFLWIGSIAIIEALWIISLARKK
jgi:integral membrane protein (TIGR01906 family)